MTLLGWTIAGRAGTSGRGGMGSGRTRGTGRVWTGRGRNRGRRAAPRTNRQSNREIFTFRFLL